MGRGVLRDRARELRRGATDAEQKLWRLLRAKRLTGYKFRRQYPIERYIADFACPAARLIAELDGSQHIASGYDARRDAWLAANGWRVLRIFNNELTGTGEGVLTAVLAALQQKDPLPNPSPEVGEGLLRSVHG